MEPVAVLYSNGVPIAERTDGVVCCFVCAASIHTNVKLPPVFPDRREPFVERTDPVKCLEIIFLIFWLVFRGDARPI